MIFLHSSDCFFNADKNKKSSIKGIDEDFLQQAQIERIWLSQKFIASSRQWQHKKFTLLLRAAK